MSKTLLAVSSAALLMSGLALAQAPSHSAPVPEARAEAACCAGHQSADDDTHGCCCCCCSKAACSKMKASEPSVHP